jgi:hypothetical protein
MIAALGLAMVGCGGPKAIMDLPADFVPVERAKDGYELRAVSAEGVVVGLRRQDNPKEGTLEFWSTAVQKNLAARNGYTLTDVTPVTAAAGDAGTLMRFDVTKEGTDLTYLVAVFVRGDDVLVPEAGGQTGAVAAIEADLRQALLSVR